MLTQPHSLLRKWLLISLFLLSLSILSIDYGANRWIVTERVLQRVVGVGHG
jgi:hypothetical protein